MLGSRSITITRKTTATAYRYGVPVSDTTTTASSAGSVQKLSGTKQEIEMFGVRISKMRKLVTNYAVQPGDIVNDGTLNYEVMTVFDNNYTGFSVKHYLAYMQLVEGQL